MLLEEAREVAAPAELRGAQFDGVGPGLPVPVAISVALIRGIGAALAWSSAAEEVGFELH